MFFGVEISINQITSSNNYDYKNSIQFGLSAEYYLLKQWSVSTRLKYYKIGVSYKNKERGSGSYSSNHFDYIYKGSVLSIPINIVWNFKQNINAIASTHQKYVYFLLC